MISQKALENAKVMKKEFAGQIIDCIEDILTDKGYTLRNADRDDDIESGDIDADTTALIYGSDYDLFGDPLVEIIEGMDENTDTAGIAKKMQDIVHNGLADVMPRLNRPVTTLHLEEILGKTLETVNEWLN